MHVQEVENFRWRILLYFMFTKWKKKLERSTIFHVHEVEKFNCRTLRYFKSTKWRCLARKTHKFFFQQNGKRLTGKFAQISYRWPWKLAFLSYDNISCLQIGKCLIGIFWKIFISTKQKNFNQITLRNFVSTKWKMFNWEI